MKFYFTMPAALKVYCLKQLEKYKNEVSRTELQRAWRQLERAYI